MSSQKNLYPQIDQSNPNSNPYSQSSSNSMYPSLQNTKDLAENLFPDSAAGEQQNPPPPAIPFESSEEIIVKIPSAIVHLIDKQQSIELASGDLEIIRLRQSGNVVAVLARIGTLIQWPLAKDEAAVKLDGSHYFFTLRVPSNSAAGEDSDQNSGAGKFSRQNENSSAGENSGAGKYSGEKSGGGKYSGGNSGAGEDSGGFSGEELINYGLTISGCGGSEELDRVLEEYSAFRVEEVGREVAAVGGGSEVAAVGGGSEVAAVGGGTAEEKAAAYWTTLAPNVEDYSGSVARLIASGSGQVIKGILWCGDVTVERLKWGNEFLKIRMKSGGKMEVSPETLKRMKRVKKLTKMSENVAIGLLTGVVKVSGFFTGSIVNSKPGKKFFKLLPGEIVLASLDGFNKVCDAVEVAGRNVMSTTSTVTTDLVSHKHGEDAAKVTTEGMHAAGHAIGTAWAVFKIRKALNPKSAVKPTTLVKAAASKSGSSKSKSKSQ